MIRSNRQELIENLESQGICFSHSVQVSTGSYLPSDADWNYRDIPHLNFIHSQVAGALALANDDTLASLLVQKIGPIKVILTTVLMSDGGNRQFYFTSAGPMAILIQTEWIAVDESHTKVTTTYSVGAPVALKFLRGLVHKILARNYRMLMTEDLPMRDQRGILRARGYSFRQDLEGHSYSESMKISKNNLIRPQNLESQIHINLNDVNGTAREFWDQAKARSVVAYQVDNFLHIGFSVCPHEGAPLVSARCEAGNLECPWHGRKLRPIASLNLESGSYELNDKDEITDMILIDNCLTLRLPT